MLGSVTLPEPSSVRYLVTRNLNVENLAFSTCWNSLVIWGLRLCHALVNLPPWNNPNHELLTTFPNIFGQSKFLLFHRKSPPARIPLGLTATLCRWTIPVLIPALLPTLPTAFFSWHLFPGACLPSLSQPARPTGSCSQLGYAWPYPKICQQLIDHTLRARKSY